MRVLRSGSHSASGTALILAVCLLFAQCFGLIHRIAHAPNGNNGLSISESKQQALHHAATSCAAFDEACLAAALHTPVISSPALPGIAVLSLWVSFLCWQQPLLRHFSSRAPPAA